MVPEELADKIYRRLDEAPFEIRLLRFLPPELPRDEAAPAPVPFALEYIHLNTEPIYHALSYTWKDDDVKEDGFEYTISLDGIAVPVSRNLYLALKQFQQFATSDGDYFAPFPVGTMLWVDALCINQSDMVERSHQVRNMRKIYQNAEIVNIWLGLEFEGCQLGMKLAMGIEEHIRGLGSITAPYEWLDPMIHAMYGDKSLKPSWTALQKIHLAGYWRRLWVIQEIVTNLRTYVHVGPLTTHLMPLLTTGQSIVQASIVALKPTQWEQQYVASFQTGAIMQDRFAFSDKEYEGHDLLDLLVRYRHHRSSDPRDKVYGLIGLAKLHGSNFRQLNVDYDLSLDAVMTQTARHIIESTKSLDILTYAESGLSHCSEDGEDLHAALPTWVPNWACLPNAWSGMRFDGEVPFASSGSEKAEVRFLDHGGILICKGVSLGTIQAVHPQPREDEPSQSWTAVLRNVLLSIHKSSDPMASGRPSIVAMQKIATVLWDLYFSYLSPAEMIDMRLQKDQLNATCAALLETDRSEAMNQTALDQSEADAVEFFRVIDGRKLFSATIAEAELNGLEQANITAIGMTLRALESGDDICVLHGCKMPVILRKHPREADKFVLVSVAYVDGYMYGEALQGREVRDFEIL